MSWSERVLPWLSGHAISLVILLLLLLLADWLYARAYHRQTNLVGLARRLAQIQRPRPQPPQSEDR
jgi:hypothetical protein